MTILRQLGIDHRGLVELGGALSVFGLAFVRHMPAPYENQLWYGAFFDTVQDRFTNNDRIGLRRKRTAVTPPVTLPKDKGPTK